MVETVTYRVSGWRRNLRWTSMIHSTRNPRDVSFTSDCTCYRYSGSTAYIGSFSIIDWYTSCANSAMH